MYRTVNTFKQKNPLNLTPSTKPTEYYFCICLFSEFILFIYSRDSMFWIKAIKCELNDAKFENHMDKNSRFCNRFKCFENSFLSSKAISLQVQCEWLLIAESHNINDHRSASIATKVIKMKDLFLSLSCN